VTVSLFTLVVISVPVVFAVVRADDSIGVVNFSVLVEGTNVAFDTKTAKTNVSTITFVLHF